MKHNESSAVSHQERGYTTGPTVIPSSISARATLPKALGEQRFEIAVFAVLLLTLLVALLVAKDLPMVDLPQHAAQLTIWLHANNPIFHADKFVINYRTPYWLSYLIVGALERSFGLTIALKLTIWLSIVGQVTALRWLCKRLGHDPWLGLLGLPLALGYNFLFGFLSYIVAAPLLLVAVALGTAYRQKPTLRGGALLTLSLLLVLLAHGITYAQALMCLGLLLLTGRGSLLVRQLPLAVSVFIGWLWLFLGAEHPTLGADIWDATFERFRLLPGLLLGSGMGDSPATMVGLLLLILPVVATRRPVRDISLALPLLATLAGYGAFPAMFRGYGPLWPRFAWLVVPTLLLAFQPLDAESHVRRSLTRWGVFGVATGWLVLFGFRLRQFNTETAPLHAVVATMSPNLRIRPIVFEPQCAAFPYLPALNHLPAYYSVSKGGFQGYSFAMYPSSPVRYRADILPMMAGGMEWAPEAFRVDFEASLYDCFLVHSVQDRTFALFGGYTQAITLRAHVGNWWNYCWNDAFRN